MWLSILQDFEYSLKVFALNCTHWEILPKLAKNKENSENQNIIFFNPRLVAKALEVWKISKIWVLNNFLLQIPVHLFKQIYEKSVFKLKTLIKIHFKKCWLYILAYFSAISGNKTNAGQSPNVYIFRFFKS